MSCQLPVPHWTNKQRVGLLSAIENVADGYIILDFGDILPVHPAETAYYLIYTSSNLQNISDVPAFIATSNRVLLPPEVISLSQNIIVRAAQLGIADDISVANLIEVNDSVYVYPGSAALLSSLGVSDGYIALDSFIGYPDSGYLQIEDEIIKYSEIVEVDEDHFQFVISDRDPFGCNDIRVHSEGVEVLLFKGFEDQNRIGFKISSACNLPSPKWVGINTSDFGIKRAGDLGLGTSVKVEWYYATPPAGFSKIHYNIYQSTSLANLFKEAPIGVSVSNSNVAIVPDVDPGTNYYYGVKAAYHVEDIDFDGFELKSEDFFSYPDSITLVEGFSADFLGDIEVSNTENVPLVGYIRIGSEIIKYSGKTSNSLNIQQRDVFSIGTKEEHPSGTDIYFFKGIEDSNSRFYRVVSSWGLTESSPQLPLPDGYNEYLADGYNGAAFNQDEDGYRSIHEDIVNEDHSNHEDENADFPTYPFCGYRQSNPVKLYSQEQCGTYHGGRRWSIIPGVNNGNPVQVSGGVDVFGSSQNREELILSVTGEPFVLLRRKTTGKKCPRLSIRSEHPHSRCFQCFGTGFLGGYERYFNEREIQAGVENVNGFVNMRVSPYNNDLELTADRGLAQVDVIDAWTTSIPIIKDRDIMVRFMLDNSTGLYVEDFRYEVQVVNRNKLFFGKDGKQSVQMRKMDKTREQYKINIEVV